MTTEYDYELKFSDVPEEEIELTPVPPGVYLCSFDKVDPVSKEGYAALNIQLRIVDGQFANRVIFDFLIYRHATSVQAQTIGEQRLMKLGRAIGCTDSVRLDEVVGYNGVVNAVISISPPRPKDDLSGEYWPARNRVKTYKPASPVAPVEAVTPSQPLARRPAPKLY